MSESYKRRPKDHVFRLVARRNNSTPNFALLVGAGASITSGVKLASQMVDEWRQQLYAQSKSAEPFRDWLQKQPWYGDDEEYGILFEKVCDQPSQRRIYIEECVKNATPSWGYIYLASLISNRYFNVIFTPNFDDLLNEACFLYTGCKPIVCAHDSAVSGIRVTSNRLKILKLHGDFLYDSIKNTIKETDVLEKNMQSKFMQFSREYGLIVIGYGGNDRSIMDILDSMVRPSEPEPYFPNGLYWCHRKGGKISKKLDRLLQREKAYLVEIDGFDEFMAELHQFLGCSLPASVRDPYKATTDRLNSFVSEKAIDHPVIRQHANELENQIKGFEKAISGTPAAEDLLNLVPYGLLTKLAFDKNRHEDVLTYGCKALEKDPDNIMTVYMMGVSYIALERPDEALKVCEDILAKKPGDFLGSKLKGTALNHMGKIEDAISVHNEIIAGRKITASERASSYTSLANCFLLKGDWQSALENSEKALELDPEGYNSIGNKCLALKNIGRFEEAKEILTKTLPKIQDDYTKACYLATLEEKDKMLKHLAEAIRKDRYLLASAKFDPDFNAYRSDPEFRKLVYDERKERGNSQQTSTSKS